MASCYRRLKSAYDAVRSYTSTSVKESLSSFFNPCHCSSPATIYNTGFPSIHTPSPPNYVFPSFGFGSQLGRNRILRDCDKVGTFSSSCGSSSLGARRFYSYCNVFRNYGSGSQLGRNGIVRNCDKVGSFVGVGGGNTTLGARRFYSYCNVFRNYGFGAQLGRNGGHSRIGAKRFYSYCNVFRNYGFGSQMGCSGIVRNCDKVGSFVARGECVNSRIGAKRFYYVDRHQVHHFRRRGLWNRWYQNPRMVFIVVVVAGGLFVTIYYGHLEIVPYTKRKHLVVLSHDMERKLGEGQFKDIKKSFKGKILPAIHPDSVRVRLIAQDIISALQRGLRKEDVGSDLSYIDWPGGGEEDHRSPETLKALSEDEGIFETKWSKDDEIIDDKWIQKSRKEGIEKGVKAETSHLEKFNWEVVVVDEPVVNAFCLPGGKIVVFTGLLKHFRTDPEIATIVGHEVAHAVARHVAEGITKNLWFAILQIILFQFVTPDIANAMSSLLLRLPFSRKMEIEADYIGILIMAAAGYDPRVAPMVFEKLGKLSGDSKLKDYLSTHPSGKTRAQLLARAPVMEEALRMYSERVSGHGIEGFL